MYLYQVSYCCLLVETISLLCLQQKITSGLWDSASVHEYAVVLLENSMCEVIEAITTRELMRDVAATELARTPASNAGQDYLMSEGTDGQAEGCQQTLAAAAFRTTLSPAASPPPSDGSVSAINYRLLEICFGILANLCSFDDLALHIAQHHADLLQLLLGTAIHQLNSAACLVELCRLGSAGLSAAHVSHAPCVKCLMYKTSSYCIQATDNQHGLGYMTLIPSINLTNGQLQSCSTFAEQLGACAVISFHYTVHMCCVDCWSCGDQGTSPRPGTEPILKISAKARLGIFQTRVTRYLPCANHMICVIQPQHGSGQTNTKCNRSSGISSVLCMFAVPITWPIKALIPADHSNCFTKQRE